MLLARWRSRNTGRCFRKFFLSDRKVWIDSERLTKIVPGLGTVALIEINSSLLNISFGKRRINPNRFVAISNGLVIVALCGIGVVSIRKGQRDSRTEVYSFVAIGNRRVENPPAHDDETAVSIADSKLGVKADGCFAIDLRFIEISFCKVKRTSHGVCRGLLGVKANGCFAIK